MSPALYRRRVRKSPHPAAKVAGQSASYPACAPGGESKDSPSSLYQEGLTAITKNAKSSLIHSNTGYGSTTKTSALCTGIKLCVLRVRREATFVVQTSGGSIISAYRVHRSYRPDQSRRKGMTTWFIRCAIALVIFALASTNALADPIPPGGQADRLKVIGFSGLGGHYGAFKMAINHPANGRWYLYMGHSFDLGW